MDPTTYENLKTLFLISLILSVAAILYNDLLGTPGGVLKAASVAVVTLAADYIIDNFAEITHKG